MCRISSPIHCTPPRTVVVECVVVVAIHCRFVHIASNKKSFSKVKKSKKKKTYVVLFLKPSSLSAVMVVAVHCRFVHVASNKNHLVG